MPQTTPKTPATQNKIIQILKEYGILTAATLLMAFGIYLFRFPNNFSFGGVTGIAVILAPFLPVSASTLTLILNVALLVLGLAVLGGGFGIKTIYVTLLLSGALSLAEIIYPMDKPLTTQPLLELIFAVVVPSIASAIFFNHNASSGGTDIVAMILTKYTRQHQHHPHACRYGGRCLVLFHLRRGNGTVLRVRSAREIPRHRRRDRKHQSM